MTQATDNIAIDELAPRVRTARQYMSFEEIKVKFLNLGYLPEDIFFAYQAAIILDGK